MTIKSGWTELLKWVGWIDVIVSGVAALQKWYNISKEVNFL